MARKETSTAPTGAKLRSPPRNQLRPRRRSTAETGARSAVVATARRMSELRLSPGRSGNVSVRHEGGMLITPSGVAYVDLADGDIVFVASDGTCPGGQRKPSSEWQFHLAALAARPDRNAVVHCHSPAAVVLACRHEPIPAFHYMVAVAGGRDIPCVPYAIFGSDDLARHVADGLRHRDACLMANHGQTAIGVDLASALELAGEVETLAAQYVEVLKLGGPKLLSDGEMDEVLEKFKTYGQRAQAL
ncbi:MAG: class II aldolase/adducin family protein [Hyphomicrobiaceae bacterium]